MSMRVVRINELASTPAKGNKPAKTGMLPVSAATVWRWARNNPDFPKPFKLGASVTAWHVADIEAFIAKQASGGAQ
jgi:prophage regulatory protein